MSNNLSNIAIQAVDSQYGAQHRVQFTTVADVASSLGGKYFKFSTIATKFYVWYDTGASVDPAPAGYTAVHVVIVAGDSAALVASKSVTAINAAAGTNLFHSSSTSSPLGNVLVLEAKKIGTPLEDAAVSTSTFTYALQKQGFSLDLGYFEAGDVEVVLDEQLLDVKTHQTGSEIIAALRTGVVAGPIKLNLLEAVAAKLKTLLEKGIGVEVTPSGGGATAVTAIGGSKLFQNVTFDGGKLVLHPANKLVTDKSEDWAFWLSYPKLDGLVFSGENIKKIKASFQVYIDDSKRDDSRRLVIGDHEQNFLK